MASGRLRALLHAQQAHATRNATAQQPLLHVAHPRECNTQHAPNANLAAVPESAAESRRQRVLALLAERPGIRYAVITDTDAHPDAVILALAIRGAMPDGSTVTGELAIPREKYDPFLLLELIERHGGSVH